METWYWTIFALLFGACTGSFLNVVIYRWPRGISLMTPRRSFCPVCEQHIGWYDNIPVLSYLRLRGRCRHCHQPISMQYPLVELATMLVFVITFDAFFAGRQRFGIGDMGYDWPILIAHWILWAGMIALAVMDLEAYMVDIAITWMLLPVGMVGHALWTPWRSEEWIRPTPSQAVFALAVVIGLLIGALLFLRRHPQPECEPSPDEEASTPAPESLEPAKSGIRPSLVIALVLVVAYGVVLAWMGDQPALRRPPLLEERLIFGEMQGPAEADSGAIRLAVGLAMAFVGLALAASYPSPQADEDIIEAIHQEAPDARRNALGELKLLLPAIVLSLAAVLLFASSYGPSAEAAAKRCLQWTPFGHWRPIWGISAALTGWVIGGAIGWMTRILCTLALGKEALGMGDVHIMAAAGAVAGWPVVLIGFFLSSVLALLGLGIIHLRRQSRALPYGPWLALGFLVASVYQDRILLFLQVRWLFDTR